MRFWFRQTPRTSGDELARAVSKSSAEWSAEIERLTAERSDEEQRRDALVEDAGRAELDGSEALVSDLSNAVVRAEGRIKGLGAAITTAKVRHGDALLAEERQRMTAKLRRLLDLQAGYLELEAAVRDAQQAVAAAIAARNRGTDPDVSALYSTLVGAGVQGIEALEDLTEVGRHEDTLRRDATRLREAAQTAVVDASGVLTVVTVEVAA
jgi:hypothetical protein